MDAVRHEATLRVPAKDGRAQRVHLEAAARHGVQRAIDALNGPSVPDALWYLWEWFGELDTARGEGLNGLAPITYQSIDAWARLTGRAIAPHEVQAILAMDLRLRFPDVKEDVQ